MEKKKLFIIVGILLLSVGVTFSYFVSQVFMNGTGSKTTITTANINGANLKVEGTLNFSDENIYPGHSSISGIKVTATGNNELVPYNLIWNGTNTISQLNYKVYKTSSEVDIRTECEKKMKVMDGAQVLSEFCEFTNLDKLGEPVETGTINKDDTKVTLVKDEFITATSDGDTKYYYVILEFPNLESIQNADLGGSFTGKVTVEESDKKPDITILAFKVEQDDGSYKEQTDIPVDSGDTHYIFNQENSTCTNGAIPNWSGNRLTVDNLTKSGTSCYLAFDKVIGQTSSTIIAKIESNTAVYRGLTEPTFGTIATGAESAANNGIYKVLDSMYGANKYSYYWRGAATSNHVIFADKCWRIIRINGDGTMRLIYNGAVLSGNKCFGNGSNSESIVSRQAYNPSYDRSEYVGYTYTIGSQRTTSGSPSNLKSQTDSWYTTNIKNAGFEGKVADGKFCNDRNTASGYSWSSQPSSTFYYAGYIRSGASGATPAPTLACPSGDVYILKAGAITMDEVVMAGAKWGTANDKYYLYNEQYYWTMSPHSWWYGSASVRNAEAFYVHSAGQLAKTGVSEIGFKVRPVINLKPDVTFNTDSNGTADNPYIVVD